MISNPTTGKGTPLERPARGGSAQRRVRRSAADPRQRNLAPPVIADQFGINAASKFARQIGFKERLAKYLQARPWHSTSEAVVVLASRGLVEFEDSRA